MAERLSRGSSRWLGLALFCAGAACAEPSSEARREADVPEGRGASGGSGAVHGEGGSPAIDRDAAVASGRDAAMERGAADASVAMPTMRYTNIRATSYETCGVGQDGVAYCWGQHSPAVRAVASNPQLAPVTDWQVVQRAVGGCGLREYRAYCWWSSLLLHDSDNGSDHPSEVLELPEARALTVRDNAACTITLSHSLYCWGANVRGQLGVDLQHPDLQECVFGTCSRRPIRVGSGDDWQFITLGFGQRTCGIRSGSIFCWGAPEVPITGPEAPLPSDCPSSGDEPWPCHPTPQPVFNHHSDWIEVATGQRHTCALRDNGEVHCVSGSTNDPARGPAHHPDLGTGSPIADLHFSQVTAGRSHSCGVADGRIHCWGRNDLGQLGDGLREHPDQVCVSWTTTRWDCAEQPVEVAHPAGRAWSYVTAGDDFNCALDSEGYVYCWGDNARRQLGQGPSTNVSFVPIPIHDPVTW